MSSEQLNSLIALKFAEDYGKYVAKYYNSSWQPIARTFPTNKLVKVPSVFSDSIGIATVRGPVLRLMYKQTENHEKIFPAVFETTPYKALLLIKKRAQLLLSSTKFSFFVVCSLIAKYCHSFIRNNRSEMLYIPLIALADIIEEEGIATTYADWTGYTELALGLLASKISPDTLEQRKVSKGNRLGITYSTFWGRSIL